MQFQSIIQNTPKAVFLDLDNTLYEYKPANEAGMFAVYTKLENMFPLKKEILEEAFLQAREEIKKQLPNRASSHSRLLYFQRMLEILGMNTQALLSLDLEQTFWRSYLRNAKLFENVKSFLYALRAKQIKTAIVTDLVAQIQLRKLVHFDIDGLIDYVVTSEEAGVEKPHPDIFNLALAKVDCKAHEVWMIGDSLEKDIKGAKALGIRALLKVDKNDFRQDEICFSDFRELNFE